MRFARNTPRNRPVPRSAAHGNGGHRSLFFSREPLSSRADLRSDYSELRSSNFYIKSAETEIASREARARQRSSPTARIALTILPLIVLDSRACLLRDIDLSGCTLHFSYSYRVRPPRGGVKKSSTSRRRAKLRLARLPHGGKSRSRSRSLNQESSSAAWLAPQAVTHPEHPERH